MRLKDTMQQGQWEEQLKKYGHAGPLRSELEVSKACLAPQAPRKARSARLLESADLRFSIGYEAKPFGKDRKAKVSKALGLATDLTNTSVRSASSVLPKARWTASHMMTVHKRGGDLLIIKR